jgi:hypothetical protein
MSKFLISLAAVTAGAIHASQLGVVDRDSCFHVRRGVSRMTKINLAMLAVAAFACSVSAFAGDTSDFVTAVPEPGTLGLLAAGIVGTAIARLRKRK